MIVVCFFPLACNSSSLPKCLRYLEKTEEKKKIEKKKIMKHFWGCYMIGKLQIPFVGFLANGNATSDRTDK